MKLTNTTGLPQVFMNVAERLLNSHPKFDNSVFSVTELLKSEKQIVYQRRYDSVIENDVQKSCALIEGTAFHHLLEEEADKMEGMVSEQRFTIPFDDVSISGGFDLMDTNSWVLYDYKNTKIASVDKALAGKDDKWKKQLYMYATGCEVLYKKRPAIGILIAMTKDHSMVKASLDPDYPQNPVQMIEYDLMDAEFQSQVLAESETKARRCKHLMETGEEPEPCTYEDMWCSEDWAIRKPDGKKALKVFDNPDSALAYYHDTLKDPAYRIYHRVKEPINCKLYCNCRSVCPQGKAMCEREAICEDVTDTIIPF